METIAAISTPNAPGGIALLRMSGVKAIAIADAVFVARNHTKVSQMHGYSCAYGSVLSDGQLLDDVILTVFRAPHSYTGEDVVEITCHGGLYLCRQVLALLYANGAKPAGPGEFTKRAFLNDKLSLSQAEAVMSVIQADGALQLRQANQAKQGQLAGEMVACSRILTDLLSALAYWLDDAEAFPPELSSEHLQKTLESLRARLQRMLQSYDSGMLQRDGIATVLLGRPNAGKSSVMNWLAKQSRSIVTATAGTTRDVITESIRVGDWKLVLSDTAGIRGQADEIEAIGIAQAFAAGKQADLLLYVVDATVGWTQEDAAVLARFADTKQIVLWNKSDLSGAKPPMNGAWSIVCCSAKLQTGEKALCQTLQTLFGGELTANLQQTSVVNERQRALLSQAIAQLDDALTHLAEGYPLDLLGQFLETAANFLLEIDGKTVSNDVINGVFERFCVGK